MRRLIVLSMMLATPAFGDAECKRQAIDDMRACKLECKEEFKAAKLTCKGIDPACGLGCLAGRQACRDTADAILDSGQLPGGGTLADCATGTDGCRAALDAAKAACGAPCSSGDGVCDACVDAAQVTSFVCRDTCREAWRAEALVTALRQSCKDTFQACTGACPPAP
jgi:hypothetical protein